MTLTAKQYDTFTEQYGVPEQQELCAEFSEQFEDYLMSETIFSRIKAAAERVYQQVLNNEH